MSSYMTRKGVPSLIVFFLFVAAIAAFGAQFQAGAWYESLSKPPWNPPSWVFAPVWTVLYVGIAIAGWRLWRRTRRFVPSLTIWIAQMVLNGCWSLLFFGLHRPDIALIDIVVLLALIIVFIVTARRHSALASWLFVPYAAWVAFATALNFAIWRLNG
jgi:translocator protein